MSKKRLLCTGTCGFIFSNFVRKAIYEKQPYEIIGVDKVSNSSLLKNVYLNKNHNFYLADLIDTHVINKIFEFERPEIVIHGAAQSCVDTSLNSATDFVKNNVLATQNVIDACLKFDVKKLIYISTDEVLGALNSENDVSWTEESPLNPRNPYSATKAAGEMLIKAAHNAHGLNYIITRASNNYGPRQTPNKLIPRVIRNILAGEKIPIYGKGEQIRDWTHVFDNCDALLKLIGSEDVNNEIFNVSANQEYTNIEVVQDICNVMGKGHELIEFIKDPRGNSHDFRYSVNSTKLRSLGWEPKFKFKTALKDVCDWYIDNQWWFRQA